MKKIMLIILSVFVLVGCETTTNIEIVEVASIASTETLVEMFTDRDLVQEVTEFDESIVLEDNKDITLTESGVYYITGDVSNTTIIVEVDSEENVGLVLEDVSIINDTMPAIYIASADKVFITIVGENYLEVNGTSTVDGTNLDAAIFSKEDLVLNGTGSLVIESAANGITSKDDLKITGGTYNITCENHGLDANDSIRIADGDITIGAGNDGLHSEYEEEDSGYIYIADGTLTITAGDDGIRANSYIQIDGGTIIVYDSYEGMEATQVYINSGYINIYSSDDGINATKKTSNTVEIIIAGGVIIVEVGSGDTDGIDSNGTLTITGGEITITAPTSSIDVDNTITHTGGTVIVNGEEVSDASAITSNGGGPGKR